MASSFLTCLKKAGLLPPPAIGHGAGVEAKEEQEEDGLWSKPGLGPNSSPAHLGKVTCPLCVRFTRFIPGKLGLILLRVTVKIK